MEPDKKSTRYSRITAQLAELFLKTKDPHARMCTIAAVLHHKMANFFWTGFYRIVEGEMTVTCYQGSLACLVLKPHTGVCWSAFDQNKSIIVDDVHQFPGHIACDSRSNSEIVIPVADQNNQIVAVLDIDSTEYANFDQTDVKCLEKICAMIYNT